MINCVDGGKAKGTLWCKALSISEWGCFGAKDALDLDLGILGFFGMKQQGRDGLK